MLAGLVGRASLPRRDVCRIVIILLLLVLVAVAAVAGYLLGARRHTGTPGASSPRSPPVPAADPMIAPAADERGDPAGISGEKARIIRDRDEEAHLLRRRLTDRTATIHQLEEFARERHQLFRDLADTRTATARYRQLVIDIETNAPPRILGGSGEPDDLKLIVGVGPVLERMLHSLGVATFRQIAHWSERDVAEFDARLPEFPGRIVRDQWVTQARALHQSKYGEQA
jgi:predicted flap endonuclease-1-like 5' DNA nuclease